MNILENKYYNEEPFLTANKLLSGNYLKTREYITNNNVKTCVFVFCKDLEHVLKELSSDVITLDPALNAGEDAHIVYAIENIIFVVPFVGSPTAAFAMEELSSMGIENFIACGSAGLIDSSFDSSKFLVVSEAIRDEGASYHYADENFIAKTSGELTNLIENTFNKFSIPYELGKVWTTDGFYRETPSAIKNYKKMGAKCVDMECATWCVVAEKLGLRFAQFLYFSDAVNQNAWNFVGTKRDRLETKALITKLAYEIAKKIK